MNGEREVKNMQIQIPEILSAKPFVKWVGGKRQLLTDIDRSLPQGFAQRRGVTYVEPFVGGGAVLFYLLSTYHEVIDRVLINDINPRLVSTYRAVKNDPEKLISLLRQIQSEYDALTDESGKKDYFLRMRKRFNEGEKSDTETAALLIFLNRTCFNGLYRVNSKGEFNVPFGRYARPQICDEETLRADSNCLQRVEITCGDFEAVESDIPGDGLVYIDPPYRPLDATSSFTAYASDGFNDGDQIRLKNFVDRLSARGCHVMLSNSDGSGKNPDDRFFDNLYTGYLLHRVQAKRSVSANAAKRGRLTELLITNYPTKEDSRIDG